MQHLTNSLEQLLTVTETMGELMSELQSARDTIPETDWETMLDGPWGRLICSVMDLEYHLETN